MMNYNFSLRRGKPATVTMPRAVPAGTTAVYLYVGISRGGYGTMIPGAASIVDGRVVLSLTADQVTDVLGDYAIRDNNGNTLFKGEVFEAEVKPAKVTPGEAIGQIPVWSADTNSYEPQNPPATPTATEVPFTPAATVGATTVQAAIEEVAAEAAFLPKYRSGAWVSAANGHSFGTAAQGDNVINATPLEVHKDISLDRIGVEVTAASALGGTLRLGIYTDAGSYPGARLVEVQVPGDAVGVKEAAITQTLAPGLYWLVSKFDNPSAVGGVTSTTRSLTGTSRWVAPNTQTADVVPTAYTITSAVEGVLPATFPVFEGVQQSPARVHVRIAV